MNIVMTGFMGTGKTTVGRLVAEKRRMKFDDVDNQIEKLEGRSVADIFARSGEPAFRRAEKAAVEELSSRDNFVISAGGGAILDAENRERLSKNGILVCLRAKTGTILERLKDDLTRPLLQGEDREAKIERLMRERQTVYDLCPVQIDTDGKSINQVAEEIIQKVTPLWR